MDRFSSIFRILFHFFEWKQQSNECFEENRANVALKQQAVVTLPKYGTLQGSIALSAWTNRIIYRFLGVKYAESPSGARRFKVFELIIHSNFGFFMWKLVSNCFKAPVPVKQWHGVQNAEHHGRACPFLGDLVKMPANERKNIDIEDCLTMAIYSTNVRSMRIKFKCVTFWKNIFFS